MEMDMSIWDDPMRVAELLRLWDVEGRSAAEVAAILQVNCEEKITKNSVISKLHRLGRNDRKPQVRTAPRRPPRSGVNNATPTKPPKSHEHSFFLGKKKNGVTNGAPTVRDTRPVVYEELNIPLEERKTLETIRSSDCHWPIGDPLEENFHYCGKDRMSGLPYCEFHARRAYQPTEVQKRKRIAA